MKINQVAITAFALIATTIGLSIGVASAMPTSSPVCPVATCETQVLITDGASGFGSPFTIEDNEGRPPGQNAIMFWVDGFQVGSVNPVCTNATTPYLAREACLGGPPFNATGGHPVLSLSPDNGTTWQVLTPGDISMLHKIIRWYRLHQGFRCTH